MEELKENQSVQSSSLNTLPKKVTKDDLDLEQNSKKSKTFYWIKLAIVLIFSPFLVAFTSYSLIAPNKFNVGGVAGIAVLINAISNNAIPQSIVVFAVNLPLMIWAFFRVRKKFVVITAINIVMQTLWLLVFENFMPNFKLEFVGNGEKIFAAIAAGLCFGVAITFSFKIGGSTGGGDILALMVQKKMKSSSIAWVLFTINAIIISASIFVYYDPAQTLAVNVLPIMMAAFESFIESKTINAINQGMQSAIEFRIITDKPDEMAHALMHELSRGVTMLPAKGMYTKQDHAMLLCIVTPRQVVTLKKVMQSVDPDSFAVMTNVSQVLGLGFYQSEV